MSLSTSTEYDNEKRQAFREKCGLHEITTIVFKRGMTVFRGKALFVRSYEAEILVAPKQSLFLYFVF